MPKSGLLSPEIMRLIKAGACFAVGQEDHPGFAVFCHSREEAELWCNRLREHQHKAYPDRPMLALYVGVFDEKSDSVIPLC
jgi:hypothetical protein